MKIIQNLAQDLFSNKTDLTQPHAQGNHGFKGVEAELSAAAELAPNGGEASKEAIDAETLEALTEERPLTPEEKKQVAQLMKEPRLTKQEKLEAISLMLRKRLPITEAVMQSVHDGLTQDLLSADLRGAIAATNNVEDLMPTLLKALLKEVSGHSGGIESAVKFSEAQLDDLFLAQMNEVVLGPVQESSSDESGTRQLHHGQGSINEMQGIENRGLRLNHKVSKSIALDSFEKGDATDALRNSKAMHALSESEVPPDRQANENVHNTLMAPGVVALDPSIGRIYLRQEVKEAMKNAKVEFEKFQKTTLDQLRSIETQPVATLQKQSLQRAIEAVDKVLMKSDIPLYTSMKMEKSLLEFSSSLSDIKKLVEQGKVAEAKTALKPIVEGLEAMLFKPSAKKMIYQSGLINSAFSQNSYNQQSKGLDLTGVLGKQIAAFSEVKGSPRMVLEHLRSLGFNLEGERQQGGKGEQTQSGLNKQKTIYHVLEVLDQEIDKHKAKSTEKESPKELAQSLGNHRLINKLEEGSPKQTLDLTIPYRLDQGVFELKVHVEARKQDELLDWENFKMFFVLDTQKSGQIGIGVHTVDKKLSLTFKAENRRVVSQLGPMVDELKRSLVGVGYQLVGIQYGLLKGGEVKGDHQEATEDTGVPLAESLKQGRKGVDFKV
jgi:hypothetical protein